MKLLDEDEIRKWLINKKNRSWKRILLLLGEGELGMMDISRSINVYPQTVTRQLAKMRIDGYVKNTKNRKWVLTNYGINKLKKLQEYGTIPRRKL